MLNFGKPCLHLFLISIFDIQSIIPQLNLGMFLGKSGITLLHFLSPLLYPQEHEQLTYSSTRSKAPSVIITGLKPATKYVFHIRVRTATGYSGYSQKFEFETGDESKFYTNI